MKIFVTIPETGKIEDVAKEKRIVTSKAKALEDYKEAKKTWQSNMTDENWKRFCDAKRVCRLLGVRI